MMSFSLGSMDSKRGEWPSGGPYFSLPCSPPSMNLTLKTTMKCITRLNTDYLYEHIFHFYFSNLVI